MIFSLEVVITDGNHDDLYRLSLLACMLLSKQPMRFKFLMFVLRSRTCNEALQNQLWAELCHPWRYVLCFLVLIIVLYLIVCIYSFMVDHAPLSFLFPFSPFAFSQRSPSLLNYTGRLQAYLVEDLYRIYDHRSYRQFSTFFSCR